MLKRLKESFNFLLEEYPHMQAQDIRHAIDMSLREYYCTEYAFFTNDNIYLLIKKRINKLNINSFREKELRPLIEKNFKLMERLNEVKNTQKKNKIGDIIFYGKKDIETEEFILYSLYFKKKQINKMKIIINKEEYSNIKGKDCLFKKDNTPIIFKIDKYSLNDDIFIFKGQIVSKSIVKYELSTIISKINRKLKNKISYNVVHIDINNLQVVVKFHKKLIFETRNFIETELKKKICFEFKK